MTVRTVKSVLRTNESIRTWHTGRRIDWRKPPKPTTIVRWLHRGRTYKTSFRSACHLARLNNLSRAAFGKEITVFQGSWNTGVSASAGTHDFDSVWDVWIEGVDPWEQQRFFRRHGLGGWTRTPAQGFSWHYHGMTLPPREGQSISDDFKVAGFKVGKYVDGGYSTSGRLITSSQIADYYNEAYGLSGRHTPGSDNSWFPDNKAATIFNLDAFVARRVKDQERARRLRAA